MGLKGGRNKGGRERVIDEEGEGREWREGGYGEGIEEWMGGGREEKGEKVEGGREVIGRGDKGCGKDGERKRPPMKKVINPPFNPTIFFSPQKEAIVQSREAIIHRHVVSCLRSWFDWMATGEGDTQSQSE